MGPSDIHLFIDLFIYLLTDGLIHFLTRHLPAQGSKDVHVDTASKAPQASERNTVCKPYPYQR